MNNPDCAESEPVKIGIIGAGSRGINCFARRIAERSDARVVALCDSNTERMEGATRQLEADFRSYTQFEEMVSREALDGVIVTLPDYLHADATVALLRLGVPSIFVDKPLATTVEDCLRVEAAQRETGARVAIGFNLRHHRLLEKMKEIIASGEIGELMLMENREFYDGGRTYMARWNRKYAWSGGLWVHKGSHDFDVFNWWNEKGTPVRVMASAGLNALRPDKIPFQIESEKPVGPTCSTCAYREICPDVSPRVGGTPLFNDQTAAADGYAADLCVFLSDKDVHDNGISLVEYDNNVRASHMECFVCGFTDRLYTVAGTLGTLTASLGDPSNIKLQPRWGESRLLPVPPSAADGHGGADPLLIDNFIASVRGEREASSTIRDGIRAVAVGQAAEVAWRERRSVEISELVDIQAPAFA